MPIDAQLPLEIEESSSITDSLHILQTSVSVILLVWATIIIGFALPISHKYHGGWIFGLAWFPIILFAVISLVTIGLMPKKLFPSVVSFILPYFFIGINVFFGKNLTIENFVVQSAMLQFTACMVGYTLQAVVFPILYKTTGNRSTFIHEEAIPQLFVAILGFCLCWFEFSFLIEASIITVNDLPLIFIGVIQGGIAIGLALHRHRNE